MSGLDWKSSRGRGRWLSGWAWGACLPWRGGVHVQQLRRLAGSGLVGDSPALAARPARSAWIDMCEQENAVDKPAERSAE